MLDDIRKVEPTTQAGYVHAVRKLAAYLQRLPDTADVEDLRRFQLHRSIKVACRSLSTRPIAGLKFIFDSVCTGVPFAAPIRSPNDLECVETNRRSSSSGTSRASPGT